MMERERESRVPSCAVFECESVVAASARFEVCDCHCGGGGKSRQGVFIVQDGDVLLFKVWSDGTQPEHRCRFNLS